MNEPAIVEQEEDYTILAIRQLTGELPLNDFGLPTGIYRTDLLPFHNYQPPSTMNLGSVDEISPDAAVGEEAEMTIIQPLESMSADPFSLMSGDGDGLPDDIVIRKRAAKKVPASKEMGEYRIAGFPASQLGNAFIPLQYDEGFPAFEDGTAFWNKLSYEPSEAFMAFHAYTQLSFGRAADPDDEEDFGEAALGTRSIGHLVDKMFPGAPDKKILELIERYKGYYHLYYWGLRTKSYDMFRVVQHKQKQELRAIETQDDHYIQARKLRSRLAQYMDSEEEFWDMMTPKVALDMLKTTTQLERISAGVPASGPSVKEGARSTTFEVAYRSEAQEQAGSSGGGALIDHEAGVLDSALDDPEATRILQELVIKTTVHSSESD